MSTAVSSFDRRDAIDTLAVLGMLGLTLSWGLNGVAAKLSNAGYDPVKSFTPIAGVSSSPMYLTVGPAVQARTVGELIAHARPQSDEDLRFSR